MRRFILLLSFLFIFPSIVHSQPEILWSKRFGGIGTDNTVSIIETENGEFVLVNGGNLLKLDSEGNLSWSVGLQGTGKSVIQSNNGGFTVVGNMRGNSGKINMMIEKFDSAGNLLWQTIRDDRDDEIGYDLQQNSDGRYFSIGYYHRYHSFSSSVLAMQFSDTGRILSRKLYSGGYVDWGESISQTSDGGYIVTGILGRDRNMFLMKLDSQGDSLWLKTYGNGTNSGMDAIENSSNEFLAVGSAYSSETSSTDLLIVKTDSEGDTLWTKLFGGEERETGYGVIESPVGGYIVVGDTGVGPHHEGGGDLWLMKIDEDGELLWSKTMGGSGNDGGRSIFNTQDGGFIVSGFLSDSDSTSPDAWVLRFSPEPSIGIDDSYLKIPLSYVLLQNHPNPFNPVTNISYALPISSEVSLIIYNILGDEVARLVDGFQQAGEYKITWNASNVSSGIYFYRLRSSNFTETKKMVLLK